MALEEKGLAFTFSAVRAAYAAGGDCESDVRVDVRNLAAFVRDPAACVTCFLLPLTCTLHLQSQVYFWGLLLMPKHLVVEAVMPCTWQQLLSCPW